MQHSHEGDDTGSGPLSEFPSNAFPVVVLRVAGRENIAVCGIAGKSLPGNSVQRKKILDKSLWKFEKPLQVSLHTQS